MSGEMTDNQCAECAISGNLHAQDGGQATLIEYITIPWFEYDRWRQAASQYEARYEALASEMRRAINQAHDQLAVGVKDMTTAIARIKELEARIKELEAADD